MPTTTKLWGTAPCQVKETIDRPLQTLRRRSNGGWGSARLTFTGADLEAKVWADATLFSATASVENSGDGFESHTYELVLGPNCSCSGCRITFGCRAGGGIAGALTDADMNASAAVSANLCRLVSIPLELNLNPKLDESEQTTTINLGLKGSQTNTSSGSVSVPAPGGATVGGQAGSTTQGDASGSLTITSKKVRGNADSVALPAIYREDMRNGCGTIRVVSSTSAALAAYNNDRTGNDCRIRLSIKNTIETVDVQIQCDCQQPAGSVGPVNLGGDEFVLQTTQLLEMRSAAVTRLTGFLTGFRRPDAIVNALDRAAVDQLITLQLATENAADLEFRRDQGVSLTQDKRETFNVSTQAFLDAEDAMYDVEILDRLLEMNAQGWLFSDQELALVRQLT